MTYTVSIYCRDCTGQDQYGCFDGGSQILCSSRPPWKPLLFSDIEMAKNAGYDEIFDCGPWEFQVLDQDRNVVYDSNE